MTGLLVSSSELPVDLGAVLWISQKSMVSKMLFTRGMAQREAEIWWGAGALQALCVGMAKTAKTRQPATSELTCGTRLADRESTLPRHAGITVD